MSIYLNADCMNPETGLPSYPDKYFDLAIVDPPYGIGGGSNTVLEKKGWDHSIPSKEYFVELVRVSKNQIIWGGNYMSLNIPFYSTHTIIWDKENGESFMSDGEIAFTSFDKMITKFYRLFWMSNMMKANEKPLIHPTQKPQALYRWLIKNYAKQGDKILDTHVGSASSLVVYEEMGFEYVGYELDPDYYRDSCKRLEAFRAQPKLFTGAEIFEASKQQSLF